MGFEASTLFMIGDDGTRLYDLGLSLIATFKARHAPAAPFLTFGLDLAGASLPDADGTGKDMGVTLGLHGAGGVHGFLADKVYWRAQVGYLAAGVHGLTGQVSLGYVFGD